jgi:hypothetical protein
MRRSIIQQTWNLLRLILSGSIFMLLVPLTVRAQAFTGYTLYSPNNSRNTYLLDMNKTVVKSWSHNRSGGYSVYLLSDGSILRPAMASNAQLGGGGAEGVVQRVAWNGTVLWDYTYSSSTYLAHHDIEPMPNGNVLIIAWEVKSASQAVQAGLNRSISIWPDHIVEVQPVGTNGGNIVWQWHAWDHLIQQYNATKSNYGVIKDHPELLNINMGASGVGISGGDWMHINAISYNPDLDQIVISSHTLNEIYVIDHSTTTQEAASHQGGRSGKGGDILYRWGMPTNYGASGAQYFSVVHCATWIPSGLPGAGNIMAFNNGDNQRRSAIVELVPPVSSAGIYSFTAGSAYGPSSPTWTYTASDFYTDHLGGCQRLPNGNTLIVESTSGNMFEVNTAGAVQWSYSPGGEIVRALRYAPEYSGLRVLTTDTQDVANGVPSTFELSQNYPNPFNPSTRISFSLPHESHVTLELFNLIGARVAMLTNQQYAAGTHFVTLDASALPSGVYMYKMIAGDFTSVRKLVVMK